MRPKNVRRYLGIEKRNTFSKLSGSHKRGCSYLALYYDFDIAMTEMQYNWCTSLPMQQFNWYTFPDCVEVMQPCYPRFRTMNELKKKSKFFDL